MMEIKKKNELLENFGVTAYTLKNVQKSWNWEKVGDALRYHPGIKNLIKKNPVD
jgi:hypothetical protein